ncbi:MAG: hypothetical protein RLZZ253_2423, partial [Verrucomicrobiota bacterium]
MTPRDAYQLLAQDPRHAWCFNDSLISTLLDHCALTGTQAASLVSERLIRNWIPPLGGTKFGDPAQGFREADHPDRRAGFLAKIALNGGNPEPDYFFARARGILNAHGYIPVVCGSSASLLPFEIRHRSSDRWRFMDTRGRECCRDWLAGVQPLTELLSDAPYQIHFPVPGTELPVTGGSLALPIALAAEFGSRGLDSLCLIATGALGDGGLVAVENCELKREAAIRHGARVFICPEAGLAPCDAIHTVQIPAGTPWNTVCNSVQQELERLGILKMDALTATSLIHRLVGEGNSGAGNPRHTIPALQNALRALENQPVNDNAGAPVHLTKTLRSGRLHLASLFNHAGDPEAARIVLDQLLGEGSPAERCGIAARNIVALCDLGRFDDARLLAEPMLQLANELNTESPEQALAKLEILGAAGGDLFLPIALQKGLDSAEARQSKELLEQNLLISEALRFAPATAQFNPNENWGKSWTRLRLWHALLAPGQFAPVPPADFDRFAPGSLPYLRRIQFLAAYRRQNFHGARVDVPQWDLPGLTRGAEWLRATALKYRGSIRAQSNQPEEARSDFLESLRLLSGLQGSVFALLLWSVAAETICVMDVPPERSWEILDSHRMAAVDCLNGYGPTRAIATQISKADF